MKINIFYRKKTKDKHSIEKVYDTLIPFITPFDVNKIKMPFQSIGFVKRLFNVLFTSFNQTTINHVSGDINYVTLLLKKRSTILTIHDIYPLYRTNGFKKKLLQLFWFTFPIKKAIKIITISNFSKNEIITHFKVEPNKIQVIYNCISPQFNYNEAMFNKTEPTILHMGTKGNKNLDKLIEAVKSLKIKLVIVGEMNNTQIQKLKSYSIHFENFDNITDEELILLYQKCDMLSFVSTYEGFGLPIIEAQTIGRVVITSNLASMPEVAGEGAYFVDPFSINDIRMGISELISNDKLRENLIKKGFENVKRFEPKIIASQYIDLYNSILNEA